MGGTSGSIIGIFVFSSGKVPSSSSNLGPAWQPNIGVGSYFLVSSGSLALRGPFSSSEIPSSGLIGISTVGSVSSSIGSHDFLRAVIPVSHTSVGGIFPFYFLSQFGGRERAKVPIMWGD